MSSVTCVTKFFPALLISQLILLTKQDGMHAVCISHNLRNIICDWCPPGYPDIPYTKWRLTYAINGTQQEVDGRKFVSECVYPLVDTSAPSLSLGTNVTFNIRSRTAPRNIWTWDNNSFALGLEHVKPDPVVILNDLLTVGSGWVFATWRPPPGLEFLDARQDLLYRLTVNCTNCTYKRQVNSSRAGVNITDLQPYTTYQINIDTIPRGQTDETYRSQPTSQILKTRVVAPTHGPNTTRGLFRRINATSAWVYWQLPLHPWNGPLSYTEVEGPTTTLRIVPPYQGALVTDLPPGRHVIQLRTVNVDSDGQELRSPATQITIDPAGEVSYPEILLIEEQPNGSLLMQWSSEKETASFTFISCNSSAQDKNVCQSPIEAREIPAGVQDEWSLWSSFDADRVYGLAANNYNKQSSGLQQTWLGVCHWDGVPRPPFIVTCDSLERALRVHWVNPGCETGKKHGTIYNFTISWWASRNYSNGYLGPSPDDIKSVTVSSLDTTFKITNLTSATEYEITIRSNGRYKSSEPSNPLKQSTKSRENSPTNIWIFLIIASVAIVTMTAIVIVCLVMSVRRKLKKKIDILLPSPGNNLKVDCTRRPNLHYKNLEYIEGDIANPDLLKRMSSESTSSQELSVGTPTSQSHLIFFDQVEKIFCDKRKDDGYFSQSNTPCQQINEPNYLKMSGTTSFSSYVTSDNSACEGDPELNSGLTERTNLSYYNQSSVESPDIIFEEGERPYPDSYMVACQPLCSVHNNRMPTVHTDTQYNSSASFCEIHMDDSMGSAPNSDNTIGNSGESQSYWANNETKSPSHGPPGAEYFPATCVWKH